jgi:7,8-didemethyl-8-hydroxy-5-deazariboflavin synthase
MIQISYSPAITLVPTYECFNRCSYCNFRTDPGQDNWLSLAAAAQRLAPLRSTVSEVLILSGEVHPSSDRRIDWLNRIYQLCELALSLGFLPHTNVGYIEFSRLKQVNVSMGLMLEQVTPDLLATVHRHAPSKRPEVRLQQLIWAGELQIPFTTGLLLGLGELESDWVASLHTIAKIHDRYGHIQEVILQPYSPGSHELLGAIGFDVALLPGVVRLAREILPLDIAIQIPPNLVHQPQILLDCLAAGARDLGGIGPQDEVNPDYPHPTPESLRSILEPQGWQLIPRLPIYPQYENWLSDPLLETLRLEKLQLADLFSA